MSMPSFGEGEDKRQNMYATVPNQYLLRTHHIVIVKIVKVLGEGGFSFVYLAQDEISGVRIRHKKCHSTLSDVGRL